MKRLLILSLLSLLMIIPCRADEGLWLPLLLKDQRYKEMRKKGLKLSAEEIYSVNRACLSGAVLGFLSEGANLKSFGTGSFVSRDGLVITNYHVVMSYIEMFSDANNDFIKYGYWAKNRSEESFCRGLELKRLVRMEDVTPRILIGTEGLKGRELKNKIDENGRQIAKEATKGTKYEVRMQALFGNNQYIMNVYEVFKDIRMVAAPPFAIGKFGGNADNYSWPRHTGDFALLRVYVNQEGEPAFFSKNNVPYQPSSYLKISSKGVKDGDFAMMMGFPGSTREYIPSFSLDKIIFTDNVEKVAIRSSKMRILKEAIERNPEAKYRYTTRLSSVGNSYLRWKGEIQGVRRMELVDKKRKQEEIFKAWVAQDPQRVEKYGDILGRMERLYDTVSRYNLANTYFLEAGINGSEIVPFIGKFEKLVAHYRSKNFKRKEIESEISRLIPLSDQFFKNWDYEVDRQMFRDLMFRYYQKMDPYFHPQAMQKYIVKYNGDVDLLSREVFRNSVFTNRDTLVSFLSDTSRNVKSSIMEDPLYQLSIGYYQINVDKIARQLAQLQATQLELYDTYMDALIEMNNGKSLYPDANGSLRIGYGKIVGTEAEDGLIYQSTTDLGGMNEKYLNNLEDEDFYMPKKLRELFVGGDYGRWADKNGFLTVNFLADIHSTSGNSGSPILNDKGELIGLNFDRIWQGVASDYGYDPNIARCIAVDIRFVMFLLDKYADCQWIVQELDVN